MKPYTILEFKDGLQLVPSKWLVDEEGKCFFPSFLSQLRIDKAIEDQEDPGKDWKMHNVQRIFGSAVTYKQGVKKLSLAMRFLEVDNEVECLDEPKRSKISAHKRCLDELEDDCLSPPKKVLSPLRVIRHMPQDQNIQLLFTPPHFPQSFYTSSVPHSNIRSEMDLTSSYLSSSTSQRERNNNNDVSENIQKFLENIHKDISKKLDKISEKLQTVDKLEEKLLIVDKISERLDILNQTNEKLQNVEKLDERLQTIDAINEKLPNADKLEERLQTIDAINEKVQNVDKLDERLQTIDAINEKLQNVDKMDAKLDFVIEAVKNYEASCRISDIAETAREDLDESEVKRMLVSEFFSDVEENMFPFNSVATFEEFERKLQNPAYFVQMVNIFKEVPGKDVYTFVTGILKKIITNGVAEQYSWLGRKGKRVFKPFVLNKVIIEAVRVRQLSAPDSDIYDIVSKWLVRAKSREEKKDVKKRRSLPGKLCRVNQ